VESVVVDLPLCAEYSPAIRYQAGIGRLGINTEYETYLQLLPTKEINMAFNMGLQSAVFVLKISEHTKAAQCLDL